MRKDEAAYSVDGEKKALDARARQKQHRRLAKRRSVPAQTDSAFREHAQAALADEPLTRMDVVAHVWGVKRHPGEDDEHLVARIRRAAVNIPKMYRPSEPPENWIPPPGYRIGDAIS